MEVTDAQRRASETARIQTALDCASTNVVLADSDLNVIYMNEAVNSMLREAEADLKEQLAHFTADDTLCKSIDIFHRKPSRQRHLLANFKRAYSSELDAVARTFRIIVNRVVNAAGERLGTVVEWEDLTAERAVQRAQEERWQLEAEHARENLRIRTALDNVSSSAMMAAAGNNIIYISTEATELFRNTEREIRKSLPEFTAAKLYGMNIDAFHKRPAHQKRMLAALTGPHRREIMLGGLTFGFISNPVVSDDGERLGTVVEWVDRADELGMEEALESLVAAARSGELTQRVSMQGKSESFKRLAIGINALIDDLSSVFRRLSGSLSATAEGDLTKPVLGDYKGEFGRIKDDLNNTLMHVSMTVADLRKATDLINVASNKISAGNSNLSLSTEQQASSLEQTAASMEELTSTVRNNADNAQQANQVAARASQLAEKGGDVVSRAITAMEQINILSNKIGEIIGVIDEIAFQTNLLALNASVEPARAGEQGCGFAVVTIEVRHLASRSAGAANEIKELINDSVDKVRAGADLFNESGETLEEIVGGVKKVGDTVAEIAAASAEQASDIDQVDQAITSMDEMTQQNATLAEETSAASASLYEKAQSMGTTIGFFTVADNIEQIFVGAPLSAEAAHSYHGQDRHAGFDFFAARTAHLSWRQRIRNFRTGNKGLMHDDAVLHRDCALGVWLYSESLARYGYISDMQLMDKVHEHLDAAVREVMDLKSHGEDKEAEARYFDIEGLSTRIVGLLKSVECSVAI